MSPSKSKPENVTGIDNGIHGQYRNWFLDYASYVILERAVPALEDGLKPVQRRILHAMKEMDDGRLNKAANIIGQTMQFHPHGDASIQDALVNLGQKELLIDTQGNWGDVRTGDDAAAPRYIEARLSKFALEVAFNAKTTEWQLSYDGRKKEPVTLPMKFPLLLAQGAEGIAVGLSTKILPHNFNELIDASIRHLRGKKFELYPDFPNGGMIDAGNYNDGKRGGRIRCRAHIEDVDRKSVVIRDVPYGITTSQLIDSIVKANDQGKIKIKKVTDNTAADVEILVELAPGISSDITIDALYAFTDCETSIAPNACVIMDDRPVFLGVSELLRVSTDQTKELLRRELDIRLEELEAKWHYSSLEKIFFEEKIYKELEKKHEDWETVLQAIGKAFKPYRRMLKRDVTREDVLKLTEKPVRRIYRLDIDELKEQILGLEQQIADTRHHLENLTDYAVAYFEGLRERYGKGRDRRTEIRPFDVIEARQVAIANARLYVNRAEGFIGTGLKKDEFVTECSDLDDVIVFTKRGFMKVVRVGDKVYVGKDIIHVDIFRKGDERTTYNMIYTDGASGIAYAKRFNVTGVTREKDYDLTKGSDKSRVNYMTINPNGEAEVINVVLSPNCSARIKSFDFYFEEMDIKGRGSIGNQVTKYPIKNVKFKEAGRSTLNGRRIWFDDTVGRLNTDSKGTLLGTFDPEDRIIVFHHDGTYELKDSELAQRFDTDQIVSIEKFIPERVFTVIYLDNEKLQYNAKRFRVETTTLNNRYSVIKEGEGNRLEAVTSVEAPVLTVKSGRGAQAKSQKIKLADFVDVTGWRTVGSKLAEYTKSTEIEWVHKPEDPQQELF
jgi:topoisomerase-4 subunit A